MVAVFHISQFYIPDGLAGKRSASSADKGNMGSVLGDRSWRRKWQPALQCSSLKSVGQRSLAGFRPWGCKDRHDLVTKH